MTKKKPIVKATGSATCELFATYPMTCPLCGITVPANTPHTCRKD